MAHVDCSILCLVCVTPCTCTIVQACVDYLKLDIGLVQKLIIPTQTVLVCPFVETSFAQNCHLDIKKMSLYPYYYNGQ
jgi:hypothetical protein